MTLNQKDPMIFFWIFFINLLPDWTSLTSLQMIEIYFLHWGYRCFFSKLPTRTNNYNVLVRKCIY